MDGTGGAAGRKLRVSRGVVSVTTMTFAGRAVSRTALLFAGLAIAQPSCGDAGRRDQHYGTDVGGAYLPPDAGAIVTGKDAADAAPETGATASVDAAQDRAASTEADGLDAPDATAGADAP